MRSRPGAGAPHIHVAAGIALVAMFGASFLAAGCKQAATGARPAESYTVPDWDDLGVRSLAYIGLGGVVADAVARSSAEQIVDEELRSSQDQYVVLNPREARSRAASRDAGDVFDSILRVWRNSRAADQFLVRELCQAAGVDGILLADLLDWREETVDPNIEGASITRVEIRLAMFSARTGQLAWEARSSLSRESVTYTPSQVGGPTYTGHGGAHRGERPSSMMTRPPRAEDVARDLMQSILLALPPRSRG